MSPNQCILCGQSPAELFYKDTTDQYQSSYYRCRHCSLIFAPPRDQPTPEEEQARYDTHENDPEDEGYRQFLGRLFNPMNRLLSPSSEGLDFGSGPGPTLHLMFEEQGHTMAIYDPFYANHPEVFSRTYDFIASTETAEHLHHPGKEFERLWNCLRPGGYLGIMTKVAKPDKQFFADWHYRLDNTHVTFYTKDTFRWMARQWEASLEFYPDNVMVFQKP